MAKAKEKRDALDQWSTHYDGLEKWKNQFLIRRNGPLISGICLDETRDPKTYKPTFFFHNLLVPSPVVTLAYAAPLLSRGVYRPVKYGTSIDECAAGLNSQVKALNDQVTFSSFVAHIAAARRGEFGPQAIYLPHAFRDLIILGSFLGDTEYYESTIARVALIIAKTPGINLNLIGSIEEWEKETAVMAHQNFEVVIEDQLSKLKLPNLEDQGMPYTRVSDYWRSI